MYRFEDGTIWWDTYDYEKNGKCDKARKLDEYDEESYSRLVAVALSNEEPHRIYEDQLIEMSKLVKKDTGLPVDIWVDEGNTFQRGGHARRIKFQGDKSNNDTRSWVPMTISMNPQVMPPTAKHNLTQREVDKIKRFIVINFKLLNNLGGSVSLVDLANNMKKVK